MALKVFRKYVWGLKFELQTDHQALTYIINKPEPNSRQIRWAMALQEFDFIIKHRPGKLNSVADCLSRPLQEIRAMEEEPFNKELIAVKDYLSGGTLNDNADPKYRLKIKRMAAKYVILEGELYRRRMIGPPQRVLWTIDQKINKLKQCHDGMAHFGTNRGVVVNNNDVKILYMHEQIYKILTPLLFKCCCIGKIP